MPAETVFSSAPYLRSPGTFFRTTVTDLRLVPIAAWRLFVRQVQSDYRQASVRQVSIFVPSLAIAGTWLFLNDGKARRGRQHTDSIFGLCSRRHNPLGVFDCLNAPLAQLTASRRVSTRSHLPHETYILVGVLRAVFNFVVRLLPVAVVVGVSHTAISWTLLLAPLGVLTLVLLGLAIGLALAPAGLFSTQTCGVHYSLSVGSGSFSRPSSTQHQPMASLLCSCDSIL